MSQPALHLMKQDVRQSCIAQTCDHVHVVLWSIGPATIFDVNRTSVFSLSFFTMIIALCGAMGKKSSCPVHVFCNLWCSAYVHMDRYLFEKQDLAFHHCNECCQNENSRPPVLDVVMIILGVERPWSLTSTKGRPPPVLVYADCKKLLAVMIPIWSAS